MFLEAILPSREGELPQVVVDFVFDIPAIRTAIAYPLHRVTLR